MQTQNLNDQNDPWLNESEESEGQLAVDVYQTDKKIYIQSTIAGVNPDNLQISLHHDLLTIKGKRESNKNIRPEQYLYKECYFGSFSRSIILPSEVDSRRVEASLENGILTVSLEKVKNKPIEIKVKD